MTWRDYVMKVIEASYRPGQTFSLPSLYQRLRAAPEYGEKGGVEAFEATVRDTVNKLVNAGLLERPA